LQKELYSGHEAVPVEVSDLGDLAKTTRPSRVPTKLNWSVLSPEDFERLLFVLLSDTPGYENVLWLQKTNAADRGRDLSVSRISSDPLLATRHQRVIIQCKHWLSRSVTLNDVSETLARMTLLEPPRVDVLIVATSGRFTADAIDFAEKHNQSDRAIAIDLWAESSLERFLATRPQIIGEFKLRQTSE